MYEAALEHLGGQTSTDDEAEEYRVLCLLALGRQADAERIVERRIARTPLVAPDMQGRAPGFVTTYLQVRRRMLPLIAQTMYGLAKAGFDAGHFEAAAVQFEELIELLHADGAADPGGDIEVLADGFLRLSRSRGERASLEPMTILPDAHADVPVAETILIPAAVAEAFQPEADGAKPFSPWRSQVFGPDDPSVTPPATVAQPMPVWLAPGRFAHVTFRGSLEVVVDETGAVRSAKVLERTHPLYDLQLAAAAKAWRYEPAVKDGRPVKYRKVVEFTLRGQ
jgi:TonB family protein